MKELTVGIDIGGTNTKFGIVDRQGYVHHQGSIPTTDFEDFKDFFDGMADALREGIAFMGRDYKVVGIGVGAANGNYYTGTIERATNLKWKESLPLAKMFTDEFHIPCILTNDANAAAVGEIFHRHHAGHGPWERICLQWHFVERQAWDRRRSRPYIGEPDWSRLQLREARLP